MVNDTRKVSSERQSAFKSRGQESCSGEVTFKLRPGAKALRWREFSDLGLTRVVTRCYGQEESEQDAKVERLRGPCR